MKIRVAIIPSLILLSLLHYNNFILTDKVFFSKIDRKI